MVTLTKEERSKFVAYLREKAAENFEYSKSKGDTEETQRVYLDIGKKLMSAADILGERDESSIRISES